MNIERAVLETLRVLPPKKQAEVLQFAVSLKEDDNADAHSDLPGADLSELLSELNENELTHLEAEFDNYEQLFPRR